MTETELLQIFPEGRAMLIKKAKKDILYLEFYLKQNSKNRMRVRAEMNDTPWEELWIKEWYLDLDDTDRARLNKEISHLIWKIKFLQGKVKPSKKGITDEDIYQAKQIKIETLYRGRLRKSGPRLTGQCPFHSEKSASFVIYPSQNSFHCYGCSANGTVVDFVMRQNNLPFLEAVKLLIHA